MRSIYLPPVTLKGNFLSYATQLSFDYLQIIEGMNSFYKRLITLS